MSHQVGYSSISFAVDIVVSYVLGYEISGFDEIAAVEVHDSESCLLYTSPSPRDLSTSGMPSSA